MRKRLLIGLLTAGLVLQSSPVSALAASPDAAGKSIAETTDQVSGGQTEDAQPGGKEIPDGAGENPDGAEGNPDGGENVGGSDESPDEGGLPGGGKEEAPGGDKENPDGGKEEAPGGGEENPDGGKEETPGGGEENPDGGEEENPDDSEGNPDDGKEETPDGGEITDEDEKNPDGSEETPGDGEESPDVAEEENPDGEETEPDLMRESQAKEAALFDEEILEDVYDGGGAYQDGSFSVPGGRADQRPDDGSQKEFNAGRSLEEAAEYIYQEMLKKSAAIDVEKYGIQKSQIKDVVIGAINDHPELYYVQTVFGFSSYANGTVIKVEPTYTDGLDDAAFRRGLQEALASVQPGMTELEKAIALHEYVVLNCEYDNRSAANKPRTAYSSYGVLADGKAVCQGYALTYKLLLNEVGIECYMVTSDAMNHAWNLVKLDGQFYQVDTTWDDPVADRFGMAQHTFMFVSDAAFQSGDGRTAHHDWQVTSGSYVVDYTGTDTRYDNAFWVKAVSPLVLSGHECYYFGYGIGIEKRTLPTGAAQAILPFGEIGYWPYGGVYSGLFLLGDRLYFNTPSKIRSVSVSGTDVRDETDVLSEGSSYIYGSVYRQGEVRYMLRDNSSGSGGTIHVAELSNGVTIPVSSVMLDQESVTLKPGESVTLHATVSPANAQSQEVTWTSDHPEVAVVDAGTVTAVGEGSCIVTASAGGKSAVCNVTVTAADYKVQFVGFEGRILATVTVAGGNDAAPPPVTAPAGYEFTGWDGDYTNIRKDTVITARYRPIAYRITYQVNGGTNDISNPAAYTIEEEIRLSPASGKSGFLFTGWYMDEACEGDPIAVIERGGRGDITLYAGWRDERGLWLQAADTVVGNYIPNQLYTGKAVKPAVEVYYGDKPLKAGTDYTLSYKNNTAANLLQSETELAKAPTVVIKGKGNYTGTLTKTFVIERRSIAEAGFLAEHLTAAYNAGKPVKPVPTVTWNKKKLAARKEFTVEYPDETSNPDAYKKPGTYTILIKGCGNYTGEREIKLTVAASEERLLSKVKISKIPDQKYVELSEQGVKLTQDMPKLTFGREEILELDKDYTLDYGMCREIGTYEVVITGKGIYKGVRKTTFRIVGDSVKKAKVAAIPEEIYTGEDIEPLPYLTDQDGRELKKDVDYTLKYANNRNTGTAKITITGKGKYTGSVTKSFQIRPNTLARENPDVQAAFMAAKQVYEKGGAKPKVVLTFKGNTLREGTDYTLKYKNNTSVIPTPGKNPTVIITGKKNFKGSREMTFDIEKQKLSEVAVTAADLEENNKAGKYMRVPVLTDKNGKKLKAGTDYEKQYVYQDVNGVVLDKEDRPTAGSTLTVIVTGKGNYTGEAAARYRIIKKGNNIAKAKVKLNATYYYTGQKITLSKDDLTVTMGRTVTLTGDDYQIVGYTNNLKKGTAKVTIKGVGDYGGTKQVSFRIQSQSMRWWEKILN